jgi:hypothetical protein
MYIHRSAAVAGYYNVPFTVKLLAYMIPNFVDVRTQDELFETFLGSKIAGSLIDSDDEKAENESGMYVCTYINVCLCIYTYVYMYKMFEIFLGLELPDR